MTFYRYTYTVEDCPAMSFTKVYSGSELLAGFVGASSSIHELIRSAKVHVEEGCFALNVTFGLANIDIRPHEVAA